MVDKVIDDVKAGEKIVVSPKNALIPEDYQRALENSLTFASPLLLVGLVALQAGQSWQEVLLLVYGAALQLAIDLVRKYINKDKYIVEK